MKKKGGYGKGSKGGGPRKAPGATKVPYSHGSNANVKYGHAKTFSKGK